MAKIQKLNKINDNTSNGYKGTYTKGQKSSVCDK